VLLREGPGPLARRLRAYADYHLDSKWSFVYLQFSLDDAFPRVPRTEGLTIRLAVPSDRPRIEAELFPVLGAADQYDKRYFDRLGDERALCFIGEREQRLVHYSWLFLDAGASPLIDTPFDRRLLDSGDVYVGPVFTAPAARGFIYLEVLAELIEFLRQRGDRSRMLLLVQGKNAAAPAFYRRFGFSLIPSAQRVPLWRRWRRGVSSGAPPQLKGRV
jgi:GNAT superfamily N-acetyltransferase